MNEQQFNISPSVSDDLVHIGKKRRSGRYPYGSGERPFQRETRGKGRRAARKQAKIDADNAKSEEARKKYFEANKEKILKRPSSAEVLKYSDLLTDKEIERAIKRIEWTDKLSGYAAKEAEAQSSWALMQKVMKKVGDVKNWTGVGVELWKNIDDAVKLASGEGSQVHRGGGGGGNNQGGGKKKK